MPNRSHSSPRPHQMVISPPSPNQPHPDHIPIASNFRPAGGPNPNANRGPSTPRRYPSPSTTAGNVNPFDERRIPSPALSGGRRRGNGDDVDRLGYEDAYDLQPSPTHAYLQDFDSVPSTPDFTEQRPNFGIGGSGYAGIGVGSPRTYSPGLSSPGLDSTEKDPLDQPFGTNQYSSNHFLAPQKEEYSSRGPGGDHAGGGAGGRRGGGAGGGRGGGAGGRPTRRAPPKAYAQPDKRGCLPTDPTKRRWLFIGLPILLILIGAGAGAGAYFATRKPTKATSSATGSSGNGTTTGGTTTNTTSAPINLGVAGNGKTGSTVVTDLNVSFTYTNPFGGSWAQNPQDPYSVSGQAQSWSPSLLEKWVWGQHIVRGVNLGGWLVTEPFIVPGLYEQYQKTTPQAVDEHSLSLAMGKNLATKMEEHYKTFITEQDFADIAKAGLNWVRIPIGYWAIETRADEPYLAKVSWQYFLRAISWGRKYGIRILLDFHALPGSQNGWNHSGKAGVGGKPGDGVNWMYGVMGFANAQRHLEQIRSLTQFLSQDGIKQVVPAISLVNEVQSTIVGDLQLRSFYYQAYNLIRGITGYGADKGPIIVIHEGFEGIAQWNGFLAGADRVAIDQHPYLAFGEQNNANHATQSRIPCTWGGGTNDTQGSFGIVIGGEWSNAINNCGKWLNGVGAGNSYNSIPGSLGCAYWEEYFKWDATMKNGLKDYNMATMDALQNWFFWTWRIGNSTELGYPPSPMWHYKLGLDNGWIASDPRVAGGFCKGIGVSGGQFDGNFPASATGAVSSSVAPANTSVVAPWPPTAMGPAFTQNQVALFPTFTQTGAPMTMATLPYPSGVVAGNGWAAPQDVAKAFVTVAGCAYPNAYDATKLSDLPTALCAGSKPKARDVVQPRATPTPAPRP